MKILNKPRKLILMAVISLLTLSLAACSSQASNGEKKESIKIGYQKNGITLLLRDKQELETELKKQGYQVEWSEFSTASSILEALNAGSIDFANAGDAPSIMALSKGLDFKYIASQPSALNSEGILVPEDSDIKSIADLKGKRVAYNRASIAEYLLTQALDSKGLSINDVESVILAPPDASIAFEKGEVDAWVVWDPYMTSAENSGNKILTTAEGIVPFRSFFFATSDITEKNPDVVEIVTNHLKKVGKSINDDPTEAAEVLEAKTNLPADIWITTLERKDTNVQLMDQDAIDDLEKQVEELDEIGMTEKSINIEDYIWQP